jgi:polyphosphate kinase 2 (PPK2 family)
MVLYYYMSKVLFAVLLVAKFRYKPIPCGGKTMLKDFVKSEMPEEEELIAKLKDERAKLSAFQMKIKEAGLPVMILFEGWNAAGKGALIGKVIRNIDPRFFKVATMDREPSEEEKRYPFLYRYIKEIPEAGKFRFFDTCWMEEVVDGVLDGK